MTVRGVCVALGVGLGVVAFSAARGQPLPTAAKVDTVPLELSDAERYHAPCVLEPVRQVTLMARADGVVRSQAAKVGASVREGQEVAQLDRGEAAARLRIAQAEVKEAQAAVDAATPLAKTGGVSQTTLLQAQARLEAAQGRAELAQIELDHCTLRAPFAGRLMASPVSDGQYVTKGTAVAELADVSSLKVLVPVRRAGAAVGGAVTLGVEGENVTGKIQALIPLPETLGVLRGLASPYTAAWVVVPNTSGALEPGGRAVSPDLPVAPIATIPAHALKSDDRAKAPAKGFEPGATATAQVIRNEYVADVKVRVIGRVGPERLQVSGAFRPTDALIVSSSVPLLAGTLIRFNTGSNSGGGVIEGTTPNPAESGAAAELTPPHATNRPAPIGAPGSAVPKGRAPARTTTAPATKPAAKGAGSVPF